MSKDGLNRCEFIGNLGSDPDLRVTGGGQAVLKMSLAVNESYLDRNNVRQDKVEWVRCTIWGKRAEALGKILAKGDKLFVEGRLQTSSYEKNGEKRYSTEINVTNVILLGGKSGDGPRQRRETAPVEEPSAGAGAGAGAGEDDLPF